MITTDDFFFFWRDRRISYGFDPSRDKTQSSSQKNSIRRQTEVHLVVQEVEEEEMGDEEETEREK